ncbi:MAG: extracellular solute-binding protein [Planctomycetes bacterium]|nr:extracellular solute-binding protein [Planctomycetota bacterium]
MVLLPVLAVTLLVALWLFPRSGAGSNSLVVYCAHDAVYADQILKDFEHQTGIHVEVRYDTEATKSLGLINLIVQEQREPRCDLFWNNELLGMMDLQSQGLLEPYRGSAWQRLPEKYRDADGHWVGFGARLRVMIVNTDRMAADEQVIEELVHRDATRVAVAKPLFGTTLTHYTVLWHAWGPERLKKWHHELRDRGLREVNGNGPVKDVVAAGTCDVGLTDTDDLFVAIDDHLPVDMLPVRVATEPNRETSISGLSEQGKSARTICIPNTAAIIRGTKRLEAARKLVDYLASAETELALAQSKSRQVPLGEVESSRLPAEVQRMKPWADEGVDLRPLLSDRRECLLWLKSEYVK